MFIVLLVEAASLNVGHSATSSFSATNTQRYSIVISPLLEENIPMEKEKTSSPGPTAQAQS